MKKVILSIVLLPFCCACGEAPETGTEIESGEPTLIGTWWTTNQWYIVTDLINEDIVSDVDIENDASYRLTFNEDGSGSGSIFRPLVPEGRFYFNFTWEEILDGEESKIRMNGVDEEDSLGGVVFVEDHKEYMDTHVAHLTVDWIIDDLTTDKLVMSIRLLSTIDNRLYRYTFSKVE